MNRESKLPEELMPNYIEGLREQAITETINLFKNKYFFEPDANKLLAILKKEESMVKSYINDYSNLLTRNLIKEFKKKLLKELEFWEEGIRVITYNEGGYVNNSGVENVYIDFCIYSFYYLFYLDELQKVPALSSPQSVSQGPELPNLSAKDQNNKIKSKEEIISGHLEAIDSNKGWGYAFRNEVDYNSFLRLLTGFFESKPYSLPQEEIQLKKGAKTRFAQALKPLVVV